MKNSVAICVIVLLLAVLLLSPAGAVYAAGDEISLRSAGQAEHAPFSAGNLFPGDSETRLYQVKTQNAGPVVLHFTAEIHDGYEKLAEVLYMRVYLPDTEETLYDGLMADCPADLPHSLAAGEQTHAYSITAYLDTSVGNDYQGLSLLADFLWWYEEAQAPDASPTPAVPADPGTAPKTGDSGHIWRYVLLLAVAVSVLFLLLGRMRRERDRNG